jgi:glutamyl-tRNA synthetase
VAAATGGAGGAAFGGRRPRVRFAPSPTGYFHVGSARTALYNWLFARNSGGTFILRIEDTDTDRNREEWVDGILVALEWLGMEPDEGPYRQSERSERYSEAIGILWDAGVLYACDCTRGDVEARTKDSPTPGYDGYCRERGLGRWDGALRLRVPDEGSTIVTDVVRGEVVFPNSSIEDFVVVKSTGAPLFILANVVDDIDMGVTHVIRGEDLLPSTPKGLLLWGELGRAGFEVGGGAAGGTPRAVPGRVRGGGAGAVPGAVPAPVFAHLPMLVNERRQKLSKRKDPVAVESYRDEGYLPTAMRNYLALLGWSHPEGREILSIEEMVDSFRLEAVNHAPAFFDVDKLRWMNGEYLRAMSTEEFVARCRPWTRPPRAPWPPERFDEEVFGRMAPLVQERVTVLGEVPGMVDFLFLAEPVLDEQSWAAVCSDEAAGVILDAALAAYASCAWDAEVLHAVTRELADSVGLKLRRAQVPIRVAVTGRRVGPPLFESLAVLGRKSVLERLAAARARLDPRGASGTG